MDRTTNLMGLMLPKENPVKAAAITSFGQPPRYGDYADPVPNGPGEMLVEVLAAGLHRVARGQASGVHYSSSGGLPLVSGVEGVGRGTDDKLRYFVDMKATRLRNVEQALAEAAHAIERIVFTP